MTKVVVLNGNGTTSQTFGFFGGTLEEAKEKFLSICEENETEVKSTGEGEGRYIFRFYFGDEKLWDLLNAVTEETECGGDPPDIYILKEITIKNGEYESTGAFND